MKAIAVEKAYIGIENNKPDAIAHLRRSAEGYKGIEVVPLKVKYPQGGEKQLIAAITGREVPPARTPDRRGRRGVQCLDDLCGLPGRAEAQAVDRARGDDHGQGVREPKNLLTRWVRPSRR